MAAINHPNYKGNYMEISSWQLVKMMAARYTYYLVYIPTFCSFVVLYILASLEWRLAKSAGYKRAEEDFYTLTCNLNK